MYCLYIYILYLQTLINVIKLMNETILFLQFILSKLGCTLKIWANMVILQIMMIMTTMTTTAAITIMWRAHCRSTVNSGNPCLQPLLSNATMEGTVVFFGVRSCNDVIQQYRNRRRCFICGLFPGYIARASTAMMGQFQLRVSWRWVAEKSPEELVDGQWEPVGSAGGPGPWRNSAGVVTVSCNCKGQGCV
jgi:hypothetical protein